MAVAFSIELEQDIDGRWIAEVVELPGVMAYGTTREQAIAQAQALALRVVADRLEHDEVARDREEIGPRMLARIAKHSGLRPEDL